MHSKKVDERSGAQDAEECEENEKDIFPLGVLAFTFGGGSRTLRIARTPLNGYGSSIGGGGMIGDYGLGGPNDIDFAKTADWLVPVLRAALRLKPP